jgi:hypothetical protein
MESIAEKQNLKVGKLLVDFLKVVKEALEQFNAQTRI